MRTARGKPAQRQSAVGQIDPTTRQPTGRASLRDSLVAPGAAVCLRTVARGTPALGDGRGSYFGAGASRPPRGFRSTTPRHLVTAVGRIGIGAGRRETGLQSRNPFDGVRLPKTPPKSDIV